MTRYPFYFINETCPDCGKEKSIIMINKYGKVTRDYIYPIDHLHCNNCGKDFPIEWLKIDGSFDIPVASDEYTGSEMINNIINYANSKRRVLK